MADGTTPRTDDRAVQRDHFRADGYEKEFLEAFDLLRTLPAAVSVFGSARPPAGHPHYELGVRLGQRLAEEGLAVVTGGGPGCMEAVNRGCREGGGLSIGLGIHLPHEQGLNEYVDVSLTFRHLFARKTAFVRYSCGFVALPGGFGTLDELFEVVTLVQTGIIDDFPVVLLGSAYWQGLVGWVRDSLLHGGAVHTEEADLLTVTDDVEVAVAAMLRAARGAAAA
jgi:uncharacterized protein (TIGR00730 family)